MGNNGTHALSKKRLKLFIVSVQSLSLAIEFTFGFLSELFRSGPFSVLGSADCRSRSIYLVMAIPLAEGGVEIRDTLNDVGVIRKVRGSKSVTCREDPRFRQVTPKPGTVAIARGTVNHKTSHTTFIVAIISRFWLRPELRNERPKTLTVDHVKN